MKLVGGVPFCASKEESYKKGKGKGQKIARENIKKKKKFWVGRRRVWSLSRPDVGRTREVC